DELREPLVVAFGPAILDDEIAALDVSEITQPLPERPDEIGLERGSGIAQEADSMDSHGHGLCARRKRSRQERDGGRSQDEASPVGWIRHFLLPRHGMRSKRTRAATRAVLRRIIFANGA